MSAHTDNIIEGLNQALSGELTDWRADDLVEYAAMAAHHLGDQESLIRSKIADVEQRDGVIAVKDREIAELQDKLEKTRTQLEQEAGRAKAEKARRQSVEAVAEWSAATQRLVINRMVAIKTMAEDVLMEDKYLALQDIYSVINEIRKTALDTPAAARYEVNAYTQAKNAEVLAWIIEKWPLEPVSGRIARKTVQQWLIDLEPELRTAF